MPDPLERISDPKLKSQLNQIRSWDGDIRTVAELQGFVQGFQSQKGIYKPAGSEYALWVRQTARGVYPDKEPETYPDGSWTYRYSPEGREGKVDLELATNRGLLRCMEDDIPVGVFRQRPESGGRGGYEVLGLAYVSDFDGTHFVLRGEPIDWTALPTPQNIVPTFQPFEIEDTATSEITRVVRDQRFGVAVRRVYHEKCALCNVGYRLKGRSLALEAAHIIPVESRGRLSDLRNGVLLCRNHHALFDSYAWTIDEDLRVLVSNESDFRESAAANHVLKFESQRLTNLPDIRDDYPAQEALRWRLDAFAKA